MDGITKQFDRIAKIRQRVDTVEYNTAGGQTHTVSFETQ